MKKNLSNTSALNNLSLRGSESDRSNPDRIASPSARNNVYCGCIKILFITLTNIGDVILTTPVLGFLLNYFPEAEITVMTSSLAAELFNENPLLRRVIVYEKRQPLKRKIKLFFELKKEKFDLIIDLKNTLFGLCLPADYKTPFFKRYEKQGYKKDVFCEMLKDALKDFSDLKFDFEKRPFYIWTSEKDKSEADFLLKQGRCLCGKRDLIAVSPFAKSDTKTWPFKNFAELINKLNRDFEIVLIGSKQDEDSGQKLEEAVNGHVCNLCGKTSLRILAEVLKKCRCLIANDSAAMHLACAVEKPVAAIFGPTDAQKYAPRENWHKILSAGLNCQPCEKAQCVFNKKPAACLEAVKVEAVFEKVMEIMNGKSENENR